MYNNIPSERTSKRAIFVALLFCITLVSVLAAGYFAWMAKDLQGRMSQFQTLEELESSKEESQAILAAEDGEDVVPVFTYPEAIQVPLPTELPEGRTFLSVALHDWEEANKDISYCKLVRDYATEKVNQAAITEQQVFGDEGVRAALIAYFTVSPDDEQVFFDGIDAAMDEDDTLAQDDAMCASSNGVRKFLLLNDVRLETLEDNDGLIQIYPEVLEWSEHASDASWIIYPGGEYQVMDGYRFYPDWYGNVIIQTGYGDAGYAHWEYQFLRLEDSPGGLLPVVSVLEKCNVEPTENYEDSIMTCEVEYRE